MTLRFSQLQTGGPTDEVPRVSVTNNVKNPLVFTVSWWSA
jgi:hypothetical protein